MQWIKKMWDANYPGGNYDALRRRSGGTNGSSGASVMATGSNNKSFSPPPARSNPPVAQPNSQNSQKSMNEMKKALEEMEKERDFYFNKLRDIEILTQKVADQAVTTSPFFGQITRILYATEEGFEIPEGGALLSSISN